MVKGYDPQVNRRCENLLPVTEIRARLVRPPLRGGDLFLPLRSSHAATSLARFQQQRPVAGGVEAVGPTRFWIVDRVG